MYVCHHDAQNHREQPSSCTGTNALLLAHRANALAQGQDEDGEAPEEEQAAECTDEGVDADTTSALGGGSGGGDQEDGVAQRQGPEQGVDEGPDQRRNEVQVVGHLVGCQAGRAAMSGTALLVGQLMNSRQCHCNAIWISVTMLENFSSARSEGGNATCVSQV